MIFKSGRKEYELKSGDQFLDNKNCIQFLNKPLGPYPHVSKKEWGRLKNQCRFISVEGENNCTYYIFVISNKESE